MNLYIKKYNIENFNEWDNFVMVESINGTIYNTRKFLLTHKENKFVDESILIYNNNELVCIVPCCKNNDNNYFSHIGCTYGGIIISQKINNIENLNEIIELILQYYDNNIQFRVSDYIYNLSNIECLYYLLNKKLKQKIELSWYVSTDNKWYNNLLNKRNQKYLEKFEKNIKNIIYVANFDEQKNDYIEFYNILKYNLNNNYKTEPTHNLSEFLKLSEILKDEHKLYIAKNENSLILGGVYVILTNKQCWYTFYISRNIKTNNNNCSIIAIMKKILLDGNLNNVKYIDYGISTENQGEYLNLGLSKFKEKSLGGKPHFRYLFL